MNNPARTNIKFPQYTGKGKQMTCSCCNGSTSYVCLTCYSNADVTDPKTFVAVCSMTCTLNGKKCHEREFKGQKSEQPCEEWHQFASQHACVVNQRVEEPLPKEEQQQQQQKQQKKE